MTDPLHRADLPLKQIFWGILLVLLDFSLTLNSGGSGVSCDILHDVIGYLLISVGAGSLARIVPTGPQQKRLVLCQFIAILSIPFAILNSFIFERLPLISAMESAMSLAQLIGLCVFSHSLWVLAAQRQMRVTKLLQVATALLVVCSLLPLGMFYLMGTVVSLTGQTFTRDLTAVVVVAMLVLMLAPTIVLLVAISRMRRELNRPATEAPGDRRGFDVIPHE